MFVPGLSILMIHAVNNAVTFCGTLKSMSRREAQHAVDVYGGKVVNTFGYADFAVVGSKAIKYVSKSLFLWRVC